MPLVDMGAEPPTGGQDRATHRELDCGWVAEVACYTQSVRVRDDTPSRTLNSPEEAWMLEWWCGMYERRPVEGPGLALGWWRDRDETSQREEMVRVEDKCCAAEGSTGIASGYTQIGRDGP